MLAACLFLPLAIASWWGRAPGDATAALWLLGLFAVSIGLPFFALSANGPLLQAWFARTDHPSARNPYFLYAASNVGSFLALISYPFLVEPFSALASQRYVWAALFLVLIALIARCGQLMPRSAPQAAAEQTAPTPAPTWQQAVRWIVLAAVPSALLISVTAHISTDIAAAPFMWVIPLALYLLTFVIVFQTRPILPHDWMVAIEPLFIVALVGVMVFDIRAYLFGILALNVIAVFVITLVCHGELSRTRPDAQHLTAFYMWMSAGGVIGGIFAGLIAPNVFTWVLEYPALIVVAILCRPGLEMPTDLRTRLFWLGAIAVVAVAAYPGIAERYVTDSTTFNWTIGAMLVIAGLVSREPLPFAAVIAVVFIIGQVYRPDSDTKETMRSFFGVHKITETSDGQYRVFLHGTTIHGAERLRDDNGDPIEGPPPMITYYHVESPMGVTVKATRARVGGPIKVAVVGLGTGTFACFRRPQDSFTFYEIDASVVRMARDPNHFRYLSECAPDVPIRLGDARLTLADANDQYDLIVLDAFSSDAIPIHLMTREAMATYLARLAPHGIVLMHVSNRHMELASVVAGIAHANGMVSRMNNRAPREGEDDAKYIFTSTVVISARQDEDFGELRADPEWSVIEPPADQRIWTDDYSNVIGAVIRQYRKKYESAEEASEPETPEKAAEPAPVPVAKPEPDKK
ncbi:MAG: fused MFS/spermidine synthase [Alphaproteobacteria bacterium]|nr:fused MFS/spermidine synthase [Alphaproteobacteria bacterium]